MAKIQIKSEKLIPFGGILSIMEQFPIDKVPSTFTQISMLKEDEGKWTLAAKPDNARTFAVHPIGSSRQSNWLR